ncbi:tail needle knob [Klebsiella phage Kpn BU9]|nr:tail needle knob [Klebsiella phage Kpn BU9]
MTTLTLLSSETSDDLLTKINDALSDGKFLYGTTTVLPGESHNPVRFFQYVSDINITSGASAYDIWLQQGNTGSEQDFLNSLQGASYMRQKSEVTWSGISLFIPTESPINLINALKALTPSGGTLAPFFNITDNKLHVFNQNMTVNFKLNLIGSWAGSTENRSMTLNFVGTTGNTLTYSRDSSVTSDNVSFRTFLSIDQDGNIATNGTELTIVSNGAAFTATQVLLIAEQLVPTP